MKPSLRHPLLVLLAGAALALTSCGPAPGVGGGSGGAGSGGGAGGSGAGGGGGSGGGAAGNAARTPGQAPERPPVPVTLTPVQRRTVERTVDVTGTLEPAEEVIIAAKVSGRIIELGVDLGDTVAPGAVLARIDPVDYDVEVAQAQSAVAEVLARLGLSELPSDSFDADAVPTVRRAALELENAQSRFRRAETLFRGSNVAISEQDYTDARIALETASSNLDVARLEVRSLVAQARSRTAALDAARRRLDDTRAVAPTLPLLAPAAGMQPVPASDRYAVAQRLVSVGTFVREGDPLVRLVLPSPLRFRAAVPERFAAAIRPGQPASLRAEAQAQTVEGVVWRVAPSIDAASRSFDVEIMLDNREGLLKPGGFARAAVRTHTQDGVAFVPESAVLTFAGVRRVYSVREGKAIEHRVQPGAPVDGFVEIPAGLEGVDSVIATNLAQLAPNAPVTVTAERTGAAPNAAPSAAPPPAPAR